MEESHRVASDMRPVGVAVATPYLPELESLRGLAMLLVLFFHIDANIASLTHTGGQVVSPVLAYVRAGHSGVNLFFILSAFLLSLPFLGQAAGGKPVSLRRYFGRRALRILPLYYTAVLAASVLTATRPVDLLRGVPYLFFLNAFWALTTPLPPYSNVWWSLATEAQFYLLLPLLPLALRSRRGRLGGILALALWAIAYGAFSARMAGASTIGGDIALGLSLFGRAPLFLAGIGAAWLYLHHGAALRLRFRRVAVLRSGGADIVLFATLTTLAYLLRWVVSIGPQKEIDPSYHPWHLPEAVLWTAVLLLLLLAPLRLKPVFCNPVLKRLGVLSYSIYLLHVPVLTFTTRGLQHLSHFSIGWRPFTLFVASLVCLICVALAEVTYRGIELPFLRRKERLRS